MNRVIFFTSVLHYMFARLIHKADYMQGCVAVYLQRTKNMSVSFSEVDSYFDEEFNWISLEEFKHKFSDKNIVVDELVLSNRFDRAQVFWANKISFNKLSYLEEGMTLYMKKNHLEIADKSIKYFLRNAVDSVFSLAGIYVRNVPMSTFDKVYSFNVLPIPSLKESCQVMDLSETFSSLPYRKKKVSSVKGVVILGQWFVQKGYIPESDMLKFYKKLGVNLVSKYETVYYKPHPWEDERITNRILSECGFDLFPHASVPLELCMPFMNCRFIGFWTSALFYAKKITEKDAISVFKLLVQFVDSDSLRKQYEIVQPLIESSDVIECSDFSDI